VLFLFAFDNHKLGFIGGGREPVAASFLQKAWQKTLNLWLFAGKV